MILLISLFCASLFCDVVPIWSQRGKDSKSSSHSMYKGNTKDWKFQFVNDSAPLADAEIILNPENGMLYVMGCIGFKGHCDLFTLNADTGDLNDQSLILDHDEETWDWENVTPVMNSKGEYIFIVPPYRKTNGTFLSSMTIFSGGGQYTFDVGGKFTGAIAVFQNVLLYLARSMNPYYRFFDIYALQLNGKEAPEVLWRVANAFNYDDVFAGDMMMVSPDGFFYFKNQTFGSHPLSFFQKFDVKSGQNVANQNTPVDRVMDSIISETLTPNRLCYTSYSPNGLSSNRVSEYPASQRFLTCLDSDTLDVMFDIAIPPVRTDVTHWYTYNPSMSLDETEIYVVNGWYPISPTPSTTLYVFSADDGKVLTSYDLEHSCQSHDVPIAVFPTKSTWRFVLACVDDDKDTFSLVAMDRDGNVKKMETGSVRLVPEKNDIQVITDESDCVYYCWYEEEGYFPGYTDIMLCGKTCL